jgi:hypothetical protein
MSRHLRQLASVGVLEGTRRGHFVLYSVARERIASISDLLLGYLAQEPSES